MGAYTASSVKLVYLGFSESRFGIAGIIQTGF